MAEESLLAQIPGAAALVDRFGRWPSFHDAEVTELALRRDGISTLTIHIFQGTTELTSTGHYRTKLHTLVTFSMKSIVAMELYDFNHQNVISGLVIEQKPDGIELLLGSCYGLAGTIRAEEVSLSFVEGTPPGSIYTQNQ